MIQTGHKTVNPLIAALKAKKAMRKEKQEDREVDEGIVADFEDITDEDEDADIEMLELEQETENTGFLETTSSVSKKDPAKSKVKKNDTYVNAQEVHAALAGLFEKEHEIMGLIYESRSMAGKEVKVTADMFFIRNLLVPPNKFRPEAKTGIGQIAEAQQNNLYKSILRQCTTINQISKEIKGAEVESRFRQRDYNDLQNAWVGLQDAVNALLDNEKSTVRTRANMQPDEGIKQKLEKKDGLFRKNMMGKRVNFAARSVISPDPNIETNEIGVPPVFAKKLTYPEPVTNHNFYELKEAVLNGVERWPGAAAIENENGQVINLRTKNLEERQALANQLLAPSNTSVTGAKNKKVHRHLNNGDIVLMNRQPTLHKPSIMGHRARILPGEKTIRMHYANCNTYNADFDGDEMNMHFPQNEIARAEALQIADTDHQYLSATSGKPLRGLIQDHISMGVWLTNKDSFFGRGDYHQLLYSCLRPENNHITTGRIKTVVPSIIKPRPLWTGKQVITTVLVNITPDSHNGLTMSGKSQTSGDLWGEKLEEGSVIFQSGELLCGILDKAHLGPSNGGFVHAVYEAYGHIVAGKLLSILGRLLTKLLHMRAFSCGIEDIVLTPSGDLSRRKKLQEAEEIGSEVAAKYVTLNPETERDTPELRKRLEEVLRDESKQGGLDSVYSSRNATLSSETSAICLPGGLRKPFPRNQMQTMTLSGAKGSAVNANQISCNLGQQVLEGRRVPVMISGKTLPSFSPYETKVRAGGYITDRFLSGVKPQEYYFHAMAGREGLIDTAVKTSRSGYLQRCLIKGMEGLKVEYDTSVRDFDGSVIQFLYGEDGLDVTKQKHLTEFKFLAENYMSIFAQLNVREEYFKLVNDEAGKWQKTTMKKYKRTGRLDVMDPVLAVFNPGSVMGSTSETVASKLTTYCEDNPDNLIKDKKKSPDSLISKGTFKTLLNMKYLKSVVDPGEMVGIIAGQSVGEPSTQMTLNTFHLAGHSAKNVTLGIPRLREIVMTASTRISTPSMTLHLNPELDEQDGELFVKSITKVTLAEIVNHVRVSENIGKGIGSESAKIYDIRLDFFPSTEYQETYAIDIEAVSRTLEYKFVPQITKAIKKELRLKGEAKSLKRSAAQPEVGKPVRKVAADNEGGALNDTGDETAEGAAALERDRVEGENRDDDDDDEGRADDDDDENAKDQRKREDRAGAISYAEPDEDEAPDARESTPDADDNGDEGYVGSPVETQPKYGNQDDSSDDDDTNSQRQNLSRDRNDRIMSKNHNVTKFRFDDKAGLWCEIQLEVCCAFD
jgi:DNA-directed RNA polymerase I subunit RPA1